MKKSLILFVLVLCLVFSVSFAFAFSEEDACSVSEDKIIKESSPSVFSRFFNWCYNLVAPLFIRGSDKQVMLSSEYSTDVPLPEGIETHMGVAAKKAYDNNRPLIVIVSSYYTCGWSKWFHDGVLMSSKWTDYAKAKGIPYISADFSSLDSSYLAERFHKAWNTAFLPSILIFKINNASGLGKNLNLCACDRCRSSTFSQGCNTSAIAQTIFRMLYQQERTACGIPIKDATPDEFIKIIECSFTMAGHPEWTQDLDTTPVQNIPTQPPQQTPQQNQPTQTPQQTPQQTQTCAENWTCSDWYPCYSSAMQFRSCRDLNSCRTYLTQPQTSRPCVRCTERWNCTDWTPCVNNIQVKTCNDLERCGTLNNRPALTQSCTESCTPRWSCSNWSNCVSGIKTRDCVDLNNCNVELPIELDETYPCFCEPRWTPANTTCSSNDLITTWYYDTNNCNSSSNKPSNYTFYCDYDNNGVIGSSLSIAQSNLNLNVVIGNVPVNSFRSTRTTRKIELKENSIARVSFNYNFSNPINLNAVKIEKQASTSNFGYVIVEGLAGTKELIIDRVNPTSNSVCVKDGLTNAITDMSAGCIMSDEFIIGCPGGNGLFTCTITADNKFLVTGLTHSAVREIVPAPVGLSACIINWSCSNWSNCVSGNRTRTCVDSNNCNNNSGKPIEKESCGSSSCNPYWECGEWRPIDCSGNEMQTRNCIDMNLCGDNKKVESRVCSRETGEQDEIGSEGNTNWTILVIIAVVVIVLFLLIILYSVMNKNSLRNFKKR